MTVFFRMLEGFRVMPLRLFRALQSSAQLLMPLVVTHPLRLLNLADPLRTTKQTYI